MRSRFLRLCCISGYSEEPVNIANKKKISSIEELFPKHEMCKSTFSQSYNPGVKFLDAQIENPYKNVDMELLKHQHGNYVQIEQSDKLTGSYDLIMSDENLRQMFIQFCMERLCLENIQFLEHYIELRTLKSYMDIHQKATIMYDQFLSNDANMQINTSDAKKNTIRTILKDGVVRSRKSISYTSKLKTTLGQIAEEIHVLLSTDSVRSFKEKNPQYFY